MSSLFVPQTNMAAAFGRYVGSLPLPSGTTRSRSWRSLLPAACTGSGASGTGGEARAGRAGIAGSEMRRIAPRAMAARVNLLTRRSLEDDPEISHLTEADPPSFGVRPPV